MTQKILIPLLCIAILGSVSWMFQNKYSVPKNNIAITIHKSPYCGCCSKWGSYMEDLGYTTNVVLEEDITSVKKNFNIPIELESCHTSEIEGYIVEGHVPNEAIEKLLTEKPNIKGIGMSGMPSGSPGMPGPKEDFYIYEINHDGSVGNLFLHI